MDRWWQWAFSINTKIDTNPFTEFDQDGCDVGLQDNGKLLFLVGTGRDEVTGDFPVHKCDVKKGTSILFPILNAECSNVEPEPFFGATEDDQRECANDFIDATDELFLKIDGHEVPNPEQYRIDSPAGGFDFNAVENNPFGIPVGDGHAVSDGFWILLKNLKPGKHTIEFSGKADWSQFFPQSPQPFIFEAGATYILDVQPSEKSYYPNDYQQQNYQIY